MNQMKHKQQVPVEQLEASLSEAYDLHDVTLDFLPLGLDSNAGVYRVEDRQGDRYLLKVKSGPLYMPGCLVPRYLHDQGITAVVAPIPTSGQSLWAPLANWSLIVYPFLDGDTNWIGMSSEQWFEVGSVFRRIHQIALPTGGFAGMRRETFDPSGYARWIETVESRHLPTAGEADASVDALRALWVKERPRTHDLLAALTRLGATKQGQNPLYGICHADLHPANLLRDPQGFTHVIDWDDVMLAPKERDLIFVKTSSDDPDFLPGLPSYFDGYGEMEIDWIALSYFRYERVIQEWMAAVDDVFIRKDLEEDARADAVELLEAVLSAGGEFDAAVAAASHLPPDLA
jgi:spectinomycin phosphotransferase